MKKYIQIKVTEEIQTYLDDRGVNWDRFEKYGDGESGFEVKAISANKVNQKALEDYRYMAEVLPDDDDF